MAEPFKAVVVVFGVLSSTEMLYEMLPAPAGIVPHTQTW